MADVNANIGVNIDTSLALAQLKSLQRQISQFHTSISRSSETAALAQKSLQKNFLNSVNAIGSFSAELRTVKSTTESFTSSLEGNKFSMREYFRYAGGATKTFGRLFKSEFDTIGKVAEERVKRLQTQYIKMGRDASGAMQAVSIMPTSLDMENYGTRTAIAAQKQALFNQLMKQGSTNLLNFGKNTQWAGRQLMVGFTIPLAMVGSAATKTFMDMEAQAIKFKKVYGDLFTPEAETQEALENITELGKSFTQYGVAVSTTVGLAAEAAAAGFAGIDLQRQTEQATRLSILGQIDTQKALETTISLQNAFGMSSDKLADSINFLNAVENQTVVSLDDITTAIPKVAPVIQQLGGDVKDLAFLMTAMKEGGINASEGANALKSGLASLINPTGRASEMLESFGINAREIVTSNKGDLKATVIEFATALNQLDPLNRAQAIEQMFGKFQFARLSALFANVTKEGNQASRVLDLANSSVEELSTLSEKELGLTAESSMNKFKKTVEDLKFALIPVGQAFLEAVTPIVEFAANVLEKFSNLSDGTKKAITVITVAIGAIGPIALMAFGLLANGVANIIKLFLTLRNGYLRLTGQSQVLGESTQYLTMEQIEAAAASHSLNQAHATLTQQFTAESAAVKQLILAYQGATKAGAAFAMANPGSMMPRRTGYANGVVSVPGSGKGDTVPAMLTPGEAVIPAAMAKKYAPLIQGMIAGNIPGYEEGKAGASQSAGRGQFKKVKIPGAMNLAHFGEKLTMTGQELVAMVEGLDTTLAQNIRGMVASIENGLTKSFKVFDNRVVAQLDVINNAMDKEGKASVSLVKENLVGDAFAPVRDIELQRQLEAAAVPLEDIKDINKKLTDEMKKGFTELGDITEITSDQLDRLIRDAYEAVAKTDERVAKAHENMKQVTTAFEPGRENVRGKRVAITKESYTVQGKKSKASPKSVYTRGQERMVSPGQVPYPELGDIGINEKMIADMGLTIEQAQAKFKNLSDTVKVELSRLAGNAKEFSAAFQNEIDKVEASGIALGQAAVTSIGKGAKTASPSKETIKTGEDVGKGLEIGMQSRKDDVAKVGESLGKTATQSTSRGAKSSGPITPGQPYNIQKTQGGVTVSEVARNVPITPEIAAKAAENARVMQTSTERLRSLDRNIMGASFAISSLSGIASMSGGKLGEMSGTISKVTGAMFALQAITGLLTQTNAIALVQKRAEISGMLIGNVATKKMGFNTTLFSGGIKKLLPNLLNFGKIIGRFLGPIGIAIGIITAGASIIKYINNQREKERLAIEGLGDAALLSADKLKTLGDFFGVNPKTTRMERTGPSLVLNQEKRTQVDELKSSEGFQKDFKNDIQSLKSATDNQAKLIFNSLAIQLKGKGFAKDNIDTILKALQEESGKINVKLDFAKIDLATKEGQKELQNSAKTLGNSFGKQFGAGYSKSTYDVMNYSTGEIVTITNERLSKGLKKNLNLTSKSFAGMMNGLSGQFENGSINAEQFNQSFETISKTITDMPEPQALFLMDNVIKGLPGPLAKSALGIKNVKDQMLIAKAAALGLATITPAMIAGLKAASELGADPRAGLAAGRIRAKITKDMNLIQDVITQVVKDSNAAFKELGDGAGEKSPFQLAVEQLKNQRKEMLDTVKAYGNLRKAGVDAGKAFALAKDPILAAAIATTKVGTKKWKELIQLIKETDAALIKSKLTEVSADTQYIKQFTAIVPVLKSIGLNAEEINDIFSDPSFAQEFIKGIKDGKMTVSDLNKLIDQTMQNRTARLIFETSLKTDDEIFDDQMNKANEMFDVVQAGIEAQYRGQISAGEKTVSEAQDSVSKIQEEIDDIQTTIDEKQRDLEVNITREIEKFQTQIDNLQADIKKQFDTPLEKLSDEGGILSNILSLIDRQESKINEKYDAQAAALTKISEINSEIASQQKQQLGLADALSRGDIAAAAAAAQEMRASAATGAQGRQSGILESARTAELDAVTVNEITRAQIEERQFQISQESFDLQQQRKIVEQEIADIERDQIAPLTAARVAAEIAIRTEQDAIYEIQQERLIPAQSALTIAEGELKATQDKLTADLAVNEQNKQAWADAKTARDLSLLDQESYAEALVATDALAKGILDKITALNTTVKTIHNIHTVYTSSGNSGDTKAVAADPNAGKFYNYYTGKWVNTQAEVRPPTSTTGTGDTKAVAADPNAGKFYNYYTGKWVNTQAEVRPPTSTTGTGGTVTDVGSNAAAELSAAEKQRAEGLRLAALQKAADAKADADARAAAAEADAAERKRMSIAAANALAERAALAAKGGGGGGATQFRAYGGKIMAMNAGGMVPRYMAVGGAVGSDTVPAMLTPGEFVMNKAATEKFGPLLSMLNESKYPSMIGKSYNGQGTPNNVSSISNNSSTMYNYNVGINVNESNASSNDIARAVIGQIKYIDSQRIRGQR